jgi:putative holliday junction resolvase
MAALTRLLGVDLGERRIGLAVGDSDSGTVRPLATLRRADAARDAATIRRACDEQRIDEVVIGLPLNMDGTEGAQAGRAREWAAAVVPLLGRPVAWHDERLTSVAAEQGMSRARRGSGGGPPSPAARDARRARIDREAAVHIVQRELDSRTNDERTL